MDLANQIYVFCPDIEKGFMFYDQSPSGAVTEMTESLPDGKFWSSGEKIVEWDDEFNGKRAENIGVNNHISVIVNAEKLRLHDDGKDLNVITIIVSHNNFLKLLYQIDNPVMESQQQYKVLDFNSSILKYDYFNSLNEVQTNQAPNKK